VLPSPPNGAVGDFGKRAFYGVVLGGSRKDVAAFRRHSSAATILSSRTSFGVHRSPPVGGILLGGVFAGRSRRWYRAPARFRLLRRSDAATEIGARPDCRSAS
jgi:hypothetical protein